MALASRDKIRKMLKIAAGVTYYDATIDDLLLVADQIVLDEIGLDSESSTAYSEKIDVTSGGQNELALAHRPVASVVALTIDGELLVENTDYAVDNELGFIKLLPLSASFPTGRQVVDITYNAGFASVPADIEYAANIIAVQLFNRQAHVGFETEKTSSYSYRLSEGQRIPPIAQRILSKHKRIFARGIR